MSGQLSKLMRAKRNLLLVPVLVFCYYVGHDSISSMDDSSKSSVKHEELTEEAFIQILQQRNENIKSICEIYSEQNFQKLRLYSNSVILMEQEKIAMCPVYKCATSSWFRNLIELSIANEEQKTKTKVEIKKNEHGTIKRVSKPSSSSGWMRYVKSLDNFANVTGFIVVRHPFERLVSAYRDKVEYPTKRPFKKFASKTVKRYRDKAIQNFGNARFETIQNFGSTLPKKLNNEKPSNIGDDDPSPSFWEFVQVLINDYSIKDSIKDNFLYMHIRPIYDHCCMCHEDQLSVFRYILRFEELEKEEPAFIRYMRWENKINISQPKLNVQRPDGLTSEEITKLYFTQLSKDEVLSLYNFYKLDFLLFNYTFKFGDMVLPTMQ